MYIHKHTHTHMYTHIGTYMKRLWNAAKCLTAVYTHHSDFHQTNLHSRYRHHRSTIRRYRHSCWYTVSA